MALRPRGLALPHRRSGASLPGTESSGPSNWHMQFLFYFSVSGVNLEAFKTIMNFYGSVPFSSCQAGLHTEAAALLLFQRKMATVVSSEATLSALKGRLPCSYFDSL